VRTPAGTFYKAQCLAQKPVTATNDTAQQRLTASAVTLPGQDAARSATFSLSYDMPAPKVLGDLTPR
jgi:hypothetical protein